MKIQSKHKDYYDYVAHMYGGGDPPHTYVRNNLEEDIYIGLRHEVKINLPHYDVTWENAFCHCTLNEIKSKVSFVYFCGKRYMIVSDSNNVDKVSGKIYNKERDGEFGGFYDSKFSGMRIWRIYDRFFRNVLEYSNVEDPDAFELSKEYNLPVFAIKVSLGKVYISKIFRISEIVVSLPSCLQNSVIRNLQTLLRTK